MQADLFAPFRQPEHNLLPFDGEVYDHGRILNSTEADAYWAILLPQTPWQPDEAVLFGRRIRTARAVAWYGDGNFGYTYAGVTRRARPWTPALRELKQRVEQHCGAPFNACLLNLYHHGAEGMGWHSDNEAVLGPQPLIASLSLGATRRFCLKHKRSGSKRELCLQHGQLLVMRGTTQQHWLHRLPPMHAVTDARINLTFRVYMPK